MCSSDLRYDRVGHLYQGRFYSNLVAKESYLREVTRYVHLNPVRAGLVDRPDRYPWSSYKWYVTKDSDPLALVEPDRMLCLFGLSREEQTVAYRQFVEELLGKETEGRAWIKRLQQHGIIPPHRWLRELST